MRSYHRMVFDGTLAGTSPVYTDPRFNVMLALTELIEIGCVISQASGTTPTLTVQCQISPDGVNWVDKSTTAEVDAASLSTSALTIAGGHSLTTDSTIGFVRLKMTLGASDNLATFKVFVTGRGEQVLRV
jgi:hypothetical protein